MAPRTCPVWEKTRQQVSIQVFSVVTTPAPDQEPCFCALRFAATASYIRPRSPLSPCNPSASSTCCAASTSTPAPSPPLWLERGVTGCDADQGPHDGRPGAGALAHPRGTGPRRPAAGQPAERHLRVQRAHHPGPAGSRAHGGADPCGPGPARAARAAGAGPRHRGGLGRALAVAAVRGPRRAG